MPRDTAADEEPDTAVPVWPETDLAALVEDATEGTAFILQPGVHRGRQVEPRDGMSFVGTSGAIMSGAVELGGFTSEGEVWVLPDTPSRGRDHGDCISGYAACQYTQDLFVDDVMLWQVADREDLEPGTWYREGDAVYIADDPTNRRVELSVTPYAFIGSADDVTIADLVVEKYATPAQEGAIQSQEAGDGDRGVGWTIERVEVRGVHGAGIRTGDATVIRDSYVHHNGQLGVTAAGSVGLLIEGSEISHNNVAGFQWEWEAGGVKVTNTEGVVFRSNFVHDNTGPGLWADIDAIDTTYEDNRVVDNTGPGIFHEISLGAVIHHNTVEGNGLDNGRWLWGAGILVAGSTDVEVHSNVVTGNANGIAGIQQSRGSGTWGPRLLADLYVHDNTIDLEGGRVGIVQDVGDKAVFTDRNNRFEANTYVEAKGHNYDWNNRRLKREGWVEAGQDTNGSWE